jgi:eukaryotic-like serine/threonine-protein kinase
MPTNQQDLTARLQAALGDTYRLEKELGGGGMSRVYLATEVRLNRQVVVKVLPPEMAAGVNVDRFEREIQLAARLQHPHVVPLLTAAAEGDLLYYVMPFIKGESLRARLAREGELPVGAAVRILRDVADALAYAHAEGVVHRDIKPDNVMLSGNHALVTDFGVAKAVSVSSGSTSLTSLGVALGTPAYMAPEQAAAEPNVDHRADLYAFGALAYELVTGRPPFTAPTAQAVLAAHVTQAPEPVTAHRAAVPPVLAELIMRCLAKKPADRYQRADEVRFQLEGMTTPSGGLTPVATQPVPAVDYDALQRRAHPLRVLGLFLLASIGLLAIVYGLVDAIGLPDWVVWAAAGLLAVGLPVLLLTSRHERRRVEAMTTGLHVTTAPGLARHFTWRKALLGGGVAFAGLAVLTGGYMAMRTLGIGPAGTLMASGALSAGEPVVLADFADRTGDASLARTVTEALRVDLGQSGAISLMSPSAVRDALDRMRRNPDTAVTETLAREIANREGLKAILAGEVSPAGAGYVLTARLISAETGDVLTAQRATASDSTGLIPAMDRLSASLRERIGESLKAIRAREPLLWATTASLPALRRYTDANRAVIAGDVDRGIDLLREAVALDTTFAEAYRKLAIELSNAGISRREMLDAMTRAYRYRDRLPDATRYLVEGSYHSSVSEDPAAVIRAYEAALDVTSPGGGGARTALNNLAVTLTGTRDFLRAREAAARAVAVAPDEALMRFNSLLSLMNLGRLDSARVEMASMDSVAPGHFYTRYAGTWLAFHERDWEEARTRSTLTSGGSPAEPVYFALQLARIEGVQGRLEAAAREYRRAERIALDNGLNHLALAAAAEHADLVTATLGDQARARTLIAAALGRIPMEPIDGFDRPHARIGFALARAGDVAGARRAVAAMEADVPATYRGPSWRMQRDSVLAALALAEGRTGEAVELFERVTAGGPCLPCGLPDLAMALEQAGQRDSALAVAERYVQTPSGFRIFMDHQELARSLFRLGELYEAKGDRAKAVEYYGQFAELWREADAELQPRVREARDRIARLSLR